MKGFSLIEVLVVAFVLATVAVALTGMGLVATRSAIEGERKNVAQNIANEKIENARTYTFDELEYSDISLIGKVSRTEDVMRNNQTYTVVSIITLEKPDLKQLTVTVSWPRGDVVVASFFVRQKKDFCVPETITCSNQSGCTPGAPASCPDSSGDLTLDCPATGACQDEEPFVECPASGQCSQLNSSPTPAPSPSASPSVSFSPSPSEPPWCQTLDLGGGVAEVCSLEGCNDFIDNDGDGGIDFGIDRDENGKCNGPNCTPPDEQCVALARDGGLFVWDSACVRNYPNSSTDCSGVQPGREIAPITSQCTLLKSCGTRRLLWRRCEVPQCDLRVDICQQTKGCPKYSTCADPLGAFSETTKCTGKNCCPDTAPKCGGRGCFECFASPPIAGGTNACPTVISFDERKNWDGRAGDWQCKGGQCVECKTIDANKKDNNCQNRKPYCSAGQCVECNLDAQCQQIGKASCANHRCI